MKLVSHEEAEQLLMETGKWADRHSSFSQSRGASSLAAAEFTLNREGKTLYRYKADEE